MSLHTDIPTRSQVERLLAGRGGARVSIYLPTSPLPTDGQADRIELKNLAGEALRQLEDADEDRAVVSELREAFEALGSDDEFWSFQARSLAVFATAGTLTTYRLPNRLSALVEVADRFYVKPLLRATTFPQEAFVLALAAGSVRLVEVLPDDPPYGVDVPGLPSGVPPLADPGPGARLQGAEGEKVRLRQYSRRVDQALRGVLTGLELPLILAAAEPLASIYRGVNSYPHLVEQVIAGNPEQTSDAALASSARGVLDAVYARELLAVRERFGLASAQSRAATDLAEVARAATAGAVDTLLADIDAKVPGFVDDTTGAIQRSDDDAASYGIVDEVARRVLLTGGRVLAVRREDMPGHGAVAAILRYAV